MAKFEVIMTVTVIVEADSADEATQMVFGAETPVENAVDTQLGWGDTVTAYTGIATEIQED